MMHRMRYKSLSSDQLSWQPITILGILTATSSRRKWWWWLVFKRTSIQRTGVLKALSALTCLGAKQRVCILDSSFSLFQPLLSAYRLGDLNAVDDDCLHTGGPHQEPTMLAPWLWIPPKPQPLETWENKGLSFETPVSNTFLPATWTI